MKKLLALSLLGLLSFNGNAAPVTLLNADFQGSGNDSVPADWTTVQAAGGYIYVYAAGGGIPAGTNVLAFHGRPNNYVEQSFDPTEVTADTYGTFVISFDAGWRNNTAAPNDLSLVFTIENVTKATTLGTATFTFPADTPSNLFNNYRVITTAETIAINYDETDPSLVGDEIALRITSSTSQNGFNPTGWIDNLSVSGGGLPDPLLKVEPVSVPDSNGTPILLTISLSNQGGTQTLDLSEISVEGVDAIDFNVTGTPGSLAPGASGDIVITFTPTAGGGVYEAEVVIDSNSGDNPTRIVPLSVRVLDPVMTITSTLVDFGTLALNPSPSTATFSVTNEGGATDLEILSANFLGDSQDFTVTSLPTDLIPPGGSASIEVTFAPTTNASGRFGNFLVVESDDPFSPTQVVRVVATVEPAPSLSDSLALLNGNFDANAYTSASNTTPNSWSSSVFGRVGSYGQGSPATPNLTSIAAHFQSVGDQFIQQDLSLGNPGLTADELDRVEVSLLAGYRNDVVTFGDILMSVGLVDLSSGDVLVAHDFIIADPGVASEAGLANTLNPLTFSLPLGAADPNSVALRISQVAPALPVQAFRATAIIDEVTLRFEGTYVALANPFAAWAAEQGLDGSPGKENGPNDDPDGDGIENLREFAFGSDPLDGSSRGLFSEVIADTDGNSEEEFLFTLAVRAGAAFGGSPSPSAVQDGLSYQIEGSEDLTAFGAVVEGPLSAAIVPSDLPAAPPAGYEYVTFRLAGSDGLTTRGFLRATVSAE